jgi:hypothetical protein
MIHLIKQLLLRYRIHLAMRKARRIQALALARVISRSVDGPHRRDFHRALLAQDYRLRAVDQRAERRDMPGIVAHRRTDAADSADRGGDLRN